MLVVDAIEVELLFTLVIRQRGPILDFPEAVVRFTVFQTLLLLACYRLRSYFHNDVLVQKAL